MDEAGGEAGAGVMGGVGWSCALAPQLENRTVATMVELSKRNRRAPKRLPAKLYMVSCAPSRVIEKPSTSKRASKFFRLRLHHTVQNDRKLVNSTELSFCYQPKDKETCCKAATDKPMQDA
jgi:hypothetical protein